MSSIPLRIKQIKADDEAIYSYTTVGELGYSYCLGPSEGNTDCLDILGLIEHTLHRLLDDGCSSQEIRMIMGLVQRDDISDEDKDIYTDTTDVDLGYIIPGQVASFQRIS